MGVYSTTNCVFTTVVQNRPALAFHTYTVCVCVCADVFPEGSHCLHVLTSLPFSHHPDRAKLAFRSHRLAC